MRQGWQAPRQTIVDFQVDSRNYCGQWRAVNNAVCFTMPIIAADVTFVKPLELPQKCDVGVHFVVECNCGGEVEAVGSHGKAGWRCD